MGFRFRRSVRIAPGIRINFNAKSTSVRIGPRGLGYTISSTGKKHVTAGIPGTGLSFTQTVAPARKAVPSQPQLIAQAIEPTEAGRKSPSKFSIAATVLVIILGLAWCSNREPHQKQPAASPPVAAKSQPEPSSEGRPYTPPKQVAAPVSAPVVEPTLEPAPPRAVAEIILYTTASVRLREEPSTQSEIIRTVPAGTEVKVDRTEGKWRRVSVSDDRGWIHGDYLAEHKPAPPKIAEIPNAPARAAPPRQSRSGEPVRAPRMGRCDCPYDLMRNGRACGGRSAYSRPGGRRPACYF